MNERVKTAASSLTETPSKTLTSQFRLRTPGGNQLPGAHQHRSHISGRAATTAAKVPGSSPGTGSPEPAHLLLEGSSRLRILGKGQLKP